MTARRIFLFALLLCAALLMSIAIKTPPAARADLAGCPMFPPNNVWNARVDNLPVHSQSAAYIASIGSGIGLHPDFGAGLWNGYPIGIPYTAIYSSSPSIPINYVAYGDQSDPGPMPIPLDAPVEGGSDHHVLVVNAFNCMLYELYAASTNANGGWDADSGAVFNLSRNAPLRPDTWTSADAAGLPILPGLARYDEVASGVIMHALRFTANCSSGNVWPARHQAPYRTSACNPLPPMGLRVRLKASYAINPAWSAQTKVILTALKTYGLILADNGSSWYISGAPNAGWVDDLLVPELSNVKGSNFEVVESSQLMLNYDSWAAGVTRVLLPAIMR